MNSTMKFICLATSTDYELLAVCPRRDHVAIQWKFIRLVLQALLSFASMYYALSMVTESVIIKGLIASLIAAFVWSFDVAMASYDYRLTGVLATESSWFKTALQFTIRVAISLVLAFGLYAIPLELKLQESAITQKLEENRHKSNIGYREIISQIEESEGLEVSALKSSIADNQERLKGIGSTLANLDSARQDLIVKRDECQTEMLAQELGLDGRPEGEGRYYKAAELCHKQAISSVQDLSFRKDSLASDASQIEASIALTQDRLMKADIVLADKVSQKKDQLTEEGIYIEQSDGLLMRLIALDQLKSDEHVGKAITWFGYALKTAILMLELMFVIISILFLSASNYNLKTRLAIKELAVKDIHAFNESVSNIRNDDLAEDTGVEENSNQLRAA